MLSTDIYEDWRTKIWRNLNMTFVYNFNDHVTQIIGQAWSSIDMGQEWLFVLSSVGGQVVTFHSDDPSSHPASQQFFLYNLCIWKVWLIKNRKDHKSFKS